METPPKKVNQNAENESEVPNKKSKSDKEPKSEGNKRVYSLSFKKNLGSLVEENISNGHYSEIKITLDPSVSEIYHYSDFAFILLFSIEKQGSRPVYNKLEFRSTRDYQILFSMSEDIQAISVSDEKLLLTKCGGKSLLLEFEHVVEPKEEIKLLKSTHVYQQANRWGPLFCYPFVLFDRSNQFEPVTLIDLSQKVQSNDSGLEEFKKNQFFISPEYSLDELNSRFIIFSDQSKTRTHYILIDNQDTKKVSDFTFDSFQRAKFYEDVVMFYDITENPMVRYYDISSRKEINDYSLPFEIVQKFGNYVIGFTESERWSLNKVDDHGNIQTLVKNKNRIRFTNLFSPSFPFLFFYMNSEINVYSTKQEKVLYTLPIDSYGIDDNESKIFDLVQSQEHSYLNVLDFSN